MMTSGQRSIILFISTYPPVKCGIASFTQDLVNNMGTEMTGEESIAICALDNKDNEQIYPLSVSMVMDGKNLDSCIKTVGIINQDLSIKLVCIEHEFGLYGGEMGEYLLGFIALLEKPFIIRFHTVLPTPDVKRLKMVQMIGKLAEKVVVMTQHSYTILTKEYDLAPLKINIIPHGTHANSPLTAEELKRKYALENKQVLTTFGLLSPNKGIEKGILAMKEISLQFPNSIYIVLGLTHPNLLLQEGEKYRQYLQNLIADNDLSNHVRLVNEYVPTGKLMEYLSLTDIYLFTSKDPDQAVSGTFLYAMGAGCAIISNSFVLAKEMLNRETGIILESNSEQELAVKAISLLSDPLLIIRMGENAYQKMRETTWDKVATRHLCLFSEILKKSVSSAELVH